jgi:hypothetical protein
MPVMLATWEAGMEDCGLRPAPYKTRDLIFKDTQNKDWKCGSSGEAPALQVQ